MRKKLIAVIIVMLLFIAAGIGVILYMENKPAVQPDETTAPESSTVESKPTETEETPVETTEETVAISLPTEDPNEVTPEDTFGDDDIVPPVTGDSGSTGETEDPDANEAPADEF